MSNVPAIEVKNLYKRYDGQVAVDDVSFVVEEGEIFGIVGPNGAGKTTTVECITGLRRPDRGSVRVLGLDPDRNRAELRQRVGAQLQKSELPENLRVGEALELYASFYRTPADRKRLIEDLGLSDKVNAPFGKLSGGQKQRLSIALALIGGPEVVVLDELTTGLDPQARRETWELVERIRDGGVTVLLVTHFMDEAERLCDRLAVMSGARIAAVGSPADLIASVNAEQRIRFRPSAPLDDLLLTSLPEVSGVSRRDDEVLVTGRGNLLHALTSALLGKGIAVSDLKVEQATLEDVFLVLTRRTADN